MFKNSASSTNISKTCIDLTDDSDGPGSSKAAIETALRELASLRAQNRLLERDNGKMKSKLRDTEDELRATRESLGKLVVDMQKTNSVSSGPSLKRARSPSPEAHRLPEAPTTSTGKVKLECKMEERLCKTEDSRDVKAGMIEPRLKSTQTCMSHTDSKRPRVGESSPNPAMEVVGPVPGTLKKETVPKTKTEDKHLFEQLYDRVRSHLKPAKAFEIRAPFFDTRIHRQKFCRQYQVNSQHFLGYFRRGKDVVRRLVFPMLEMNPVLPTSPGEPGLIFASRHEILENPPWTLFVKINPKREGAIWTYMGEYHCVICGRLEAEDFCSLSDTVKRRWAEFLLEQQLDVYLSMRVRIALRKAGVIPKDDKEEDKKSIDREKLAVKHAARERARKAPKGKHPAKASAKTLGNYSVNEDDVIKAFSKGEEWIDIIRLECTSYDHAFARELQQKFHENASNPATESNQSSESKTGRTWSTSNRGSKLARRAKLEGSPPPSNADGSEMEDEADSPAPGGEGEEEQEDDDDDEDDVGDEFIGPAGPSDGVGGGGGGSVRLARRSSRKTTANYNLVDSDEGDRQE